MKRIIVCLLVLTLLLTGCGGSQSAQEAAAESTTVATEPMTEPTTEPTTVPTTEPAPVYRNPLNGSVIDEPFTGRIFANTVSNMESNLPHVGVMHADVIIETFANSSVVRCLALFTDIESVNAIGCTRSTRPMFNDIAQHYDLILTHAGGSDQALTDARNRKIDHYNIDAWEATKAGASYRDKEHDRAYENTLYGIGAGIKPYAESKGAAMTLEREYGLSFAENGTPAGGEDAGKVSVVMTYNKVKKETVMIYDAAMGKYVWNQYGRPMQDLLTEETEAFTNVIIMFADISTKGIYHVADFDAGGTGYYANGGKLIPIVWTCAGEKEPFRFMTEDGEELLLGEGNTYINICPAESPVAWEGAQEEAVSETTAETAAG